MFTTKILVLLMNSLCPLLWADLSKKSKKAPVVGVCYCYPGHRAYWTFPSVSIQQYSCCQTRLIFSHFP